MSSTNVCNWLRFDWLRFYLFRGLNKPFLVPIWANACCSPYFEWNILFYRVHKICIDCDKICIILSTFLSGHVSRILEFPFCTPQQFLTIRMEIMYMITKCRCLTLPKKLSFNPCSSGSITFVVGSVIHTPFLSIMTN